MSTVLSPKVHPVIMASPHDPLRPDDLDVLKKRILESFLEFESSFRRRFPMVWWLTLIGPFALTIALLVMIAIAMGAAYAQRLVTTMLFTFFFFGRFVILSGTDAQSLEAHKLLSSEQLFLMVSYMDIMVAVTLAFHIGFMFRMPIVGPKIGELVADGQLILRHQPWMKRMTLLGVAVLTAFPLAATGSIGASIFGRLLGMTRISTLTAILIGTLVGNGIMYLGSDMLGKYLDKDDALIKYGGIAAIVLIIFFLERRYKAMKRTFMEKYVADSTLRTIMDEEISPPGKIE
ncbi:MAG: small multi-drug export protein [Planctomycetaceae bacterium]